MKKMLFFVCVLLLIVTCKKTVIDDPIPPVPVPDPKITLTVSSDTVFQLKSVTVSCIAYDAVKTTSNIGAPTSVNWTYPLSFTTANNFTVLVTAENKIGKTVSGEKLIIVLPARTDSISSGLPWHLRSLDELDANNNWVTLVELPPDYLTDNYYYYKGGNSRVIGANGSLIGSAKWTWVGANGFHLGGQDYTYSMTSTTFILYQVISGITYRDVYGR